MQYTELKEIPIFKSGIQRGERYDAARLRRMVRNSNRMRPHFRGVIKTKVTHRDQQPELLQQAALGQSARYYLRKSPDGLLVMGDFSGVPLPVAEAARALFPNVSVEKYKQFRPGDGSAVPDVIKSVAFLGAEAPEVKGLQAGFPGLFADNCGEIETFQMGDHEAMKHLGDVIAAKRDELGMTPEDLAAVLEIDPAIIGQIEAGDIEPDAELLQKIADAFGITPEELQAAVAEDENTEDDEGDKDEPKMYSEQDVDSLVRQAVAGAMKQAQAGFNRRIATLETKLKGTNAELFSEREERRKQTVERKLDALFEANEDGFALPAILKEKGVQLFMERLSSREEVETFAEGGEQQTELDCFAELLETVKTVGLVDTNELAGDSYERPDPDDPDAAIEKYAEEHSLDYGDAASEMSKKGLLTIN